jgi:hypothetical protein
VQRSAAFASTIAGSIYYTILHANSITKRSTHHHTLLRMAHMPYFSGTTLLLIIAPALLTISMLKKKQKQ